MKQEHYLLLLLAILLGSYTVPIITCACLGLAVLVAFFRLIWIIATKKDWREY